MNEKEFEQLYDRYWLYIYRLCYTYLKNKMEAEDSCEDTFVKLLNQCPSFTDEDHQKKWLTIVAINLCKDKLKSWQYKNVILIDEESKIEEKEHQDYSYVLEAINQLPIRIKDVVILYYYQGYSTEEIARMLKRPSSTIRNQLSEARKLLKDILKEE